MNVRTHDAACPKLDVLFDHRVRPHLHARIELGLWMHYGGWMNHW